MSISVSHEPTNPQPERDTTPRRLIVTAGVVIFAIRDWSLWVLLRDSPWGPPMRIVLGTESVTDAGEDVYGRCGGEKAFNRIARAPGVRRESPKRLVRVIE